MSDPVLSATGNAGGGIPIEHNGRVFTLHAWTDKLRARYTRWAHRFVLDELRKLKGELSPAEYDAQFAILTQDIVDGLYGFGQRRLARLTETEQGVRALIAVLLNNDLYTDEEIDDFIVSKQAVIFQTLKALNGVQGGGDGDEDPKA